MTGAAEPRSADFVAGTALGEPRSADFVAGTALCEPQSADFVAGTAHGEPRSADFVADTALGEPRSANFERGERSREERPSFKKKEGDLEAPLPQNVDMTQPLQLELHIVKHAHFARRVTKSGKEYYVHTKKDGALPPNPISLVGIQARRQLQGPSTPGQGKTGGCGSKPQ